MRTAPAPDLVITSSYEVPRSRPWVEPALILAFWTVMALLTTAGQMLFPRNAIVKPVFPASDVAAAFANAYLWAALTLPIFRLSRRFPMERRHGLRNVAVVLAVGILIAAAVDVIVGFLKFTVLYTFTGPWGNKPFDPLFGLTRLFWLDDLVVYIAILAAGFARDYFRRLQTRHDEAVRLEAQTARLEAQLAEARLAALRAQLDPHFLFNTLNAVSALVGSDPRGVRRMISRLSALLRHTLEESATPQAPLAEEMALLTQYVEIMEIRFEGRLDVQTNIDPAMLDALVPTLILQPLVENAIRHGIDRLPLAEVGRVVVSGRRQGDLVVLTVQDNGPTLDDANALTRSGGVGLRNTRERLAQLYGPEHTLTLTALPDGGVVAELTLPYHTRGDLRTTGVTESATTIARRVSDDFDGVVPA